MLDIASSAAESSLTSVEADKSSPAAPATVRVLLIDGDVQHYAEVSQFLSDHGYLVRHADNLAAAREVLELDGADVVILNVLLPGGDGLAIARELSVRRDLGVIIVSELGTELDRIVGLEAGADDYLPKPASLRELLARIRAVRRRLSQTDGGEPDQPNLYTFGGWTFNATARVLRDPNGETVNLSEGEFSLLRAFVHRPQRVLSRDQLLEFARGPHSEAYDRAVDTQVSRLRRKLRGQSDEELIRTVRNEGYLFLPRVTLR